MNHVLSFPELPDYELLELVMERYLNWAVEHDANLATVATEVHFEIPLNDRHVLNGFIDCVVRDKAGHLWLMEHKLWKRVATSHTIIDPQISAYVMGTRLHGIPVEGMIYNVVRMSNGPTARREPVSRHYVYRSKCGDDIVKEEIIRQADEMQRFLETEDKLPLVYRNPTSNCTWDCNYLKACVAYQDSGEEYANQILERGFVRNEHILGQKS